METSTKTFKLNEEGEIIILEVVTSESKAKASDFLFNIKQYVDFIAVLELRLSTLKTVIDALTTIQQENTNASEMKMELAGKYDTLKKQLEEAKSVLDLINNDKKSAEEQLGVSIEELITKFENPTEIVEEVVERSQEESKEEVEE